MPILLTVSPVLIPLKTSPPELVISSSLSGALTGPPASMTGRPMLTIVPSVARVSPWPSTLLLVASPIVARPWTEVWLTGIPVSEIADEPVTREDVAIAAAGIAENGERGEAAGTQRSSNCSNCRR